MSTTVPFATATEFLASIRARRTVAEAMTVGAAFDIPEQVADAMLQPLNSGEPRMNLVLTAYGGTH